MYKKSCCSIVTMSKKASYAPLAMSTKKCTFINDSQCEFDQLSPTLISEEYIQRNDIDEVNTVEVPINAELPQSSITPNKTQIIGNHSDLEIKLDLCIKEIHLLKKENQDLQRKLLDANEAQNKIQTRMLTEILNIKRVLGEKTTTMTERRTALPKSPFLNIEDFLQFEGEVQKSADKFKIIENEIFAIGITDSGKFVRAVWKRLVSDEIACDITWKAVEKKTSVQNLAITGAFKEAYCRKFGNEGDFKKFTIKWFQTARDRLNYKIKQQITSNKDY